MPDTARPRRSLVRLGVSAAVVAAALGALALYGIGGDPKAANCAASAETLAAVKAASVGEVAGIVTPSKPRAVPAIRFTDASGAEVGLERFHGKVVLLNLWATWCAPCRKEMPALAELQRAKGGPDFTVVPLSLDLGSPDKPRAFLKEIGASDLPLYVDQTGQALQAMKAAGRGAGLPTTLILDRAGCEIGYIPGAAEWASAEAQKLIDAALGK